MSRTARLKPVIHIGPPKTATTSLQDAVIPYLGRPYQIKPDWAWQLARQPAFEAPAGLAPDVIVSHESLGDFAAFRPEVIAARLGQVFKDAVVVFAQRDPLDLFYSLYRQKLINTVVISGERLAAGARAIVPRRADTFFDSELQRFRKDGIGFLAMLKFEANRRIFAERFDVQTLPFELLRSAPDAFVSAFTDVCGGGPTLRLPRANETNVTLMENALSASPLNANPALRERYIDFYRAPVLTDDRAHFIRNWSQTHSADAFVEAFRFSDP